MGQQFIIGICGKPGSGKDTIGNFIVKSYGFNPITLKKPIEDIVRTLLCVDDDHLYDRNMREQELEDWKGWTVRKALQGLGQGIRDIFGEEIWAKNLCKRMDNFIEPDANFVLTDIRTPADVRVVRQYAINKGKIFKLIMVQRPGYGATTVGGFTNHVLESYDLSPESDVTIVNDRTIHSLHLRVRDYLLGFGLIAKTI